MPTLNARQQAQVKAISAFKSSARGVVVQAELTLNEYITKDSFSPDNLAFFLNAMKRTPRLQQAFRKLLPSIVPVEIKGSSAKGFSVVNKENLSKKQKVTARSSVKQFIALSLNSLLDHPSIKVTIDFDWTKKSASLVSQMAKLMEEHGVTPQQLHRVVTKAEKKAKVA